MMTLAPDVWRPQLRIKSTAIFFALLISMAATQAHGEDSPGAMISTDRIFGDWDGPSSFSSYSPFLVTASSVSMGKCRHIPYTMIKNRVGIGPGATFRDGDFKENWRDVAIELKPQSAKQSHCLDELRVSRGNPLQRSRGHDPKETPSATRKSWQLRAS
jgi:hypothetical protein